MGAAGGVVRALPAAPVRVLWRAPALTALPLAPTTGPLTLSVPNPVVDTANFSSAGGAWQIDWERARRDAQTTLAQLDLSKDDIVLYVPGTSNHKVMPALERQLRASYGAAYADKVSLAYVEYESTWHMRRSAPTGLATLMLVLDELRKRKRAGQRILLSGESQGSWIIGEAMANPRYRELVERAAIVGHPFLAKHHYDDGRDPKVQEINHVDDNVAAKINGDIGTGLDAMVAIRTGQWSQLGTIVKGILANPMQGWILLRDTVYNLVPFLKGKNLKPHYYPYEMPSVVAFLHKGIRSASTKPAMAPADLIAWEAANKGAAT